MHTGRMMLGALALGLVLTSCSLAKGSGTLVVTNNTGSMAVVSGVSTQSPYVPSMSQASFGYTDQTSLTVTAGIHTKTINSPHGYEHIELP